MLVLLLMYLSKQTVTESINRIMKRINSIKPSLLTLLFLLIVLLCIYMSKKVDDASIEINFKSQTVDVLTSEKINKIEEKNLLSKQKITTANNFYDQKEYLRCESQLFGCFEFSLKPELKTKVPGEFTNIDFGEKASRKKCIEYCSERNSNYAGLRYTTCYCSSEVRKFINIRNVDSCDTKCSGNQEDSCGGENGVNLYFITSQCSKEPISLQQKLLGCFRIDIKFSEEKWTMSQQPTTLSCFTYCENKARIVSGYRSNDKQCLCAEFTSNFNLEQKVSNTNCSLYLEGNKHVEPINLWTLFRTSVEDKRCSKMKLKNGGGKESRVGLISAPSSGNTWTRYLLEKASGYFTGCAYNDTQLYSKGYLGESTSKTVIIKDHFFGVKNEVPSDVSKFYSAVIFIVRNPYDTVISDFQRIKTDSHTGVVNFENVKKKITISQPMYLSKLSKSLTLKGVPLYVIVYEELVKDPIGEIRRLLTTFAPLKSVLPNSNELEDRLMCLSSQLTGLFKRKKQKLNYDQLYSEQVEDVLNEDIRQARKVLAEAGFSIPNYKKPVV